MKQSDEQIDGDKAQQQNGDDSQHARIVAHSRRRRKFRPHPALTAAAVVAVLLTGRLAMWQFDRAEQKAALENSARAALSAAPVSINNGAKLRPYLRAAAAGKYLAEKEILIDNRVHNKTAGVHIITPLLLDGGGAIAVNRGWAKKNEIPPPPRRKNYRARRFAKRQCGRFYAFGANRRRQSAAKFGFAKIRRRRRIAVIDFGFVHRKCARPGAGADKF